MAWPKGVKREGYVRKDGQPHNKKGEGRAAGPRIKVIRREDPKYQQVESRKDEARIEKTIHGASNRPVIEPCPKCAYAYADGGYCQECGWTQHRPDCAHCKKENK